MIGREITVFGLLEKIGKIYSPMKSEKVTWHGDFFNNIRNLNAGGALCC